MKTAVCKKKQATDYEKITLNNALNMANLDEYGLFEKDRRIYTPRIPQYEGTIKTFRSFLESLKNLDGLFSIMHRSSGTEPRQEQIVVESNPIYPPNAGFLLTIDLYPLIIDDKKVPVYEARFQKRRVLADGLIYNLPVIYARAGNIDSRLERNLFGSF